jgi:hypothetical protein
MDSLTKPKCAPNQLELVFRKSIKCNSISPDGSDFSITGAYPVGITSATGICINGRTSEIIIQLSAPLQRAGNFRITLNRGSDGNTLLDECTQETPVGQFLPFEIKDTVNANFNSTIFFASISLSIEDEFSCFPHAHAKTVTMDRIIIFFID